MTKKTTRDPRVEPKAGDKTKSQLGLLFIVTEVSCNQVHFVTYESGDLQLDFLPLREWAAYSKQDEVLYAAE